jgi:lactoylglutathione lyase
MADMNGFAIRKNSVSEAAAGFEVAMVTDDLDGLYARALAAGATAVKPPEQKPWGQHVGYVRDLNGCLVELCTAITPA